MRRLPACIPMDVLADGIIWDEPVRKTNAEQTARKLAKNSRRHNRVGHGRQRARQRKPSRH